MSHSLNTSPHRSYEDLERAISDNDANLSSLSSKVSRSQNDETIILSKVKVVLRCKIYFLFTNYALNDASAVACCIHCAFLILIFQIFQLTSEVSTLQEDHSINQGKHNKMKQDNRTLSER